MEIKIYLRLKDNYLYLFLIIFIAVHETKKQQQQKTKSKTDLAMEIFSSLLSSKQTKKLPRVRIELTTFRFLIQIMRLTRCLLR